MVSGKNSGGEKWRKSWTHLPRHPPNNTSHHWPLHRMKEGIFIAITIFSRGLGALREQRPLSGSRVGNPGEQGGERGGEPRGARWGAGWGTPGSKVGSRVEERPAVHTTPQSRQSQVNPEDLLSPQSHSTYEESGAPRLPARPTSSAVCVRRQSLSLRLSQRRS